MKILVTGAAGFIGSHLAEQLVDLGHDVIGLDNFSDYYAIELKHVNAADLAEKGIPIYKLDLVKDDLTAVLEGVHVIYHLAAQPGISSKTPYEMYVRNNLHATYRLLEFARQQRELQCFVNVATSSIYGNFAYDSEEAAPKPTSFYGVTKLAAEQLVLAAQREYGFPACSLRLFSVLGPRERPEKLYSRLIRALLTDQPFPLYEGSLEHSRSYTAVSDAVAGLTAVLTQPQKAIGEIFNIGSDVEIRTADGIALVEKIMGKTATFTTQPKRAGDQLHTRANIEKAKQILGYQPSSSLEQTLTAQVKWYTEKIYAQGLHNLA